MRMELRVGVGDERKAEAVKIAVEADSKPKRGTMKISTSGGDIVIEIESDDKVAMRAALNSNLRVMDACLSTIGE